MGIMKEKNKGKTQMAIDEEDIEEDDIIRDDDDEDEEEDEEEDKPKKKAAKPTEMSREQMHTILVNHEQRIAQLEGWAFRIKSQ